MARLQDVLVLGISGVFLSVHQDECVCGYLLQTGQVKVLLFYPSQWLMQGQQYICPQRVITATSIHMLDSNFVSAILPSQQVYRAEAYLAAAVSDYFLPESQTSTHKYPVKTPLQTSI